MTSVKDTDTGPTTSDYSVNLKDDSVSPSQLQEVTHQDATFSNTMDARSPSGTRTVKEFEEQLAGLHNENFNLKLRIYFLEEKMGVNFTLDKDNIIKKNIELQVEIKNLQRELQEKHDLLCQAVKAMELEEDEHKKYVQTREGYITQLQQELEDYRLQLQNPTQCESDVISHKSNISSYYSSRLSNNIHETSDNLVVDLQERIKLLEKELNDQKENNASMQLILNQAETLRIKYDTLQKEIQLKDEKFNNLQVEVDQFSELRSNYQTRIRDLHAKLEKSNDDCQILRNKIQEENHTIDDMLSQIDELRRKYTAARTELEREHKKAERIKMVTDKRVNDLEQENYVSKKKIKELLEKLDQSQQQVKKYQNLAVSPSLSEKSKTTNTDLNSFSVPYPDTPSGSPKKDSRAIPIKSPSKSSSSLSTSPAILPSEWTRLDNLLEEITRGAGDRGLQILSDLKQLKLEYTSQSQKIIKLKSEQLKACEIIKNMIASRDKDTKEITGLKKKVNLLEHELESVVSKPDAKDRENAVSLSRKVSELNLTAAVTKENENTMDESHVEPADLVVYYKALSNELEMKCEILQATLEEKNLQMRKQVAELAATIQEKDNKIVDLEFELLSVQDTSSKCKSMEKCDVGTEKQESCYRFEIDAKDKEISVLSQELKKCKCYLQEIVNKELWEKNREIEKLHAKNVGMAEIIKLKKELSGKTFQLKVIKDTISEMGIDVPFPADESHSKSLLFEDALALEEKVKSFEEKIKICETEKKYLQDQIYEVQKRLKDTEILNERMQKDNNILCENLEKVEKLRLESNNICSLLSVRLEELAVFLNSLLNKKCVLGFLGAQKNEKLRELIDNSLEFSRSFTMSMIINPDQSLAQLSNITGLLNCSAFQDLNAICPEDDASNLSIVPSNATLTYQSHLNRLPDTTDSCKNKLDPERVISTLREHIVKLNSELKLRDNELNRLNNINTEKSSESESNDLKPKTTFNIAEAILKCISDSESEAWSEPDRKTARARMGLNFTFPLSASEKQAALFSTESTEDDDSLDCAEANQRIGSVKKSSINELQKQVSRLKDELAMKNNEMVEYHNNKHLIEDLENNLSTTQANLKAAEERLSIIDSEKVHLEGIINELQSSKFELEQAQKTKDKEVQNQINELVIERDAALSRVGSLYEEIRIAKEEILMGETVKDQMHQEIEYLKSEWQQQVNSLEKAEEEFLKKAAIIEKKASEEKQKIESKLEQLQAELTNNYVNKRVVDEKCLEVANIHQELNDLKKLVKSYEEIVEGLRTKEVALNGKNQQQQDRIDQLTHDLENISIQYSEVMNEKSKLSLEKITLEQKLGKIVVNESEMQMQLNEIQTEFHVVKLNCKEIQTQKSQLEVKLSEMESTNAELHNKLVRLQAQQNDFNPAASNMFEYKRQTSTENYTSSEETGECRNQNALIARLSNNSRILGDIDRHEATSSPDLGIESDHGRFSSLEAPAALPRPLLQTIELTESMNNLLDGDNNPVENTNIDGAHCCQDLSKENAELRRKLARSNKALEETANQLTLANQRKKQIEKNIFKQVFKTSQVLRKARANLDTESENEL